MSGRERGYLFTNVKACNLFSDPHTSGVDAARPDGGGSGGKVDKWDRMKGRLGKGGSP